MKTLSEYIFEFKQDLMPKCIVIIGGPGAGKTYWMSEHNEHEVPSWMTVSQYKKLFGSSNVSKRLDSDHNLEKYQNDNCKEIANIMLTAKVNDADKNWFDKFIQSKQEVMDKACEKGDSPKVDLSIIDWDFIEPWKNKLSNAKNNSEKNKIKTEYFLAFKKEYWKTIFASDFSKRYKAKEDYNSTYYDKFNTIINTKNEDGEEIEKINSNDVCIAICGDSIKKFEKIQKASNGNHAIYVVYLDIPEEMSIEADKNRDRTIGASKVKEKLEGVHKTWEILKKDFPKYDIYKLIHYITPMGKHPNWEMSECYAYLNGKIKKIN